MDTIFRPSNSGGRDSEIGDFIQCIDGIERQIHELWCHKIGGICCKLHPYARIEIKSGTVGEFVTEYFSENGRRNEIIGAISINGSVQ